LVFKLNRHIGGNKLQATATPDLGKNLPW